MARNHVKVLYDKEADYLEVLFSDDLGTYEETEHDSVMVRHDLQGKVIGFSILGLKDLDQDFLNLDLVASDESAKKLPR